MPLPLHIAPQAKIDVAEIAIHIGKDNPDAGLRFMQAVDESLTSLVALPTLGERLESSNPALSSVKMWPVRGFGNYLIVFRALPHSVDIIRVLHGARDIEALLGSPTP